MARKSIAILLVVLVSAFIVTAAFAEGANPQKTDKVASFFRGLFHWPFRTTAKVVTTAGNTVKNVGTVVAKEAETAGSVVTGQLEKMPNLVVEPVKGTAETVVETARGVVTAPVEAAKEVSAEQRAQEEGQAAQ